MEEQMPQSQPKKGNPSLWIVLILVALIAVAAILYFGDFFNTNTNSNTNTVVNTNAVTNTNVAVNENTNTPVVDSSNWQTYQDTQYGFSFKFPKEWVAEERAVTGGTFEVGGLIQQIVIKPKESSLDFIPASECSISVFNNAESKQIETWLENSNLYTDAGGLSIQSQVSKTFGNVDGMQIFEGGPNYTSTVSFFFTIKEWMLRFGYYKGVDVNPQDEFQADSAICNTILSTLSK